MYKRLYCNLVKFVHKADAKCMRRIQGFVDCYFVANFQDSSLSTFASASRGGIRRSTHIFKRAEMLS